MRKVSKLVPIPVSFEKIKIQDYPSEDEADYSHLKPVLDFLIGHGNKSVNEYIWGINRTGYFCHLEKDINFDDLRRVFSFPDSIKIDEEKNTIDCFNTYTVIKTA